MFFIRLTFTLEVDANSLFILLASCPCSWLLAPIDISSIAVEGRPDLCLGTEPWVKM